MIKYDIHQIFPNFILNDTNGYAMAKAIEAALDYFLGKCQEGIDNIQNVDAMPEWRLDELAWEYNCLYDYDADVEIKREWIRNAYETYRIHGTADGIQQYLNRYFGESNVEEWFEFNGDPGQFNVTVSGVMTQENEEWIRKAVAKAKNVRSELNQIIYGDEAEAEMVYATGVSGIVADDYVTMIEEEEE